MTAFDTALPVLILLDQSGKTLAVVLEICCLYWRTWQSGE